MKSLRWAMFVSATVVLLGLVGVGGAAADEPSIEVVDIDQTSLSASLTQRCGFPIQMHLYGSVRTATFTDADGLVERLILTAPGGISTTYTNLDTGATVEIFHPFNEHFERQADGTWIGVFAGVRQLVVLPGEGAIRVWAGRWEFRTDLTRRVFLPYLAIAGADRVEMTICEALGVSGTSV